MRILLAILISTTSGICSLGQTIISGNVTSLINGKPLRNVVVLFKGTTIGALTDSIGNYKLDSPFGQVTLSISWVGYKPQDTTVNVVKNLRVDFRLDAECNFNERAAKSDIRTGKMKLFLVGSIAPVRNSNNDKRFMRQFNIDYFDFGDNVIAMECIEVNIPEII